MERQETLRDLFDGVARDPETRALFAEDPDGFLADHGFGEVPADLLPEAVVHYADVAPLEVAEQLSPFVMANSPVELDEPLDFDADALGALAGVDLDLPTPDADLDTDAADGPAGVAGVEPVDDVDEPTPDLDEADGFAFGAGHDGAGVPTDGVAPDTDEDALADEAPAEPFDLLGPDPVDLDALTPDVPSVGRMEADQVEVDESDLAEDDWSDVI